MINVFKKIYLGATEGWENRSAVLAMNSIAGILVILVFCFGGYASNAMYPDDEFNIFSSTAFWVVCAFVLYHNAMVCLKLYHYYRDEPEKVLHLGPKVDMIALGVGFAVLILL